MKISIGSDHAGVDLKEQIIQKFAAKNEFFNVGTNSSDSVDYPDFAHKAVSVYKEENCEKIILICGSGNGIQMSANKHKNIRCALCWTKEIAELARLHNNANALALPARFITEKEAVQIVEVFLQTPFEGGRHKKRMDKINA
jgi:ribose 5-phosphate isomerase B|tara:strand:+ start:1647 stop:2072 length:426 start_codon:yes stop_codon:yes gene_type:complete